VTVVGRGCFISVEGIEGVGKSTNIDVVVAHIERAGYDVLTTREPGGTPLAEDIRDMLFWRNEEAIPEIAELLLMFAARSLNVRNVIVPTLDEGTWVVCDRFTDSSRAYQGGGRGVPMATIDQLAEWVHPEVWPDLTLLLDAPVDVGLSRAKGRSEPDRFEREKAEFFARVRASYLQLAKENPKRFAVIDTHRDANTVSAEVGALVDGLLSRFDIKNNT